MRALTNSEAELLKQRQAAQEAFIQDRLDVLHEFAVALGFNEPVHIVADPLAFVQRIGDWLKNQQIGADDRTWLIVRIGYFIGECLIAMFGGCWFLNSIPDSKFFGHFVVGQFNRPINPAAMADPMGAAAELANQAPGRDLALLLNEMSAAVVRA